MTYRSLLVFLDNEPLCAARTEVAARLVKQLDCHLVGVAPTGVVVLSVATDGATSLTEYAALSWNALRHQADNAAQDFRDACPAHRRRASPTDGGDFLLSLVGEVGADLLVMGCYGHSRARELMLGGASRTALQAMTIPVLMAH